METNHRFSPQATPHGERKALVKKNYSAANWYYAHHLARTARHLFASMATQRGR